MNQELREKLGAFIMECYGVDINEASFIFPHRIMHLFFRISLI